MSKLKNHSSPWIQITLLLAVITLSVSPLCCAAKHHKGGDGDDDDNGVSYSTHCNSVPPKSAAQQKQGLDTYFLVFPRNPSAINVSGGAPLLNHGEETSVMFRQFKAYKTVRADVFKLEVTLILRPSLHDDLYYGNSNYSYDSEYDQSGGLSFKLSGYIYQETGVLCMVGYGYGFSRKGDRTNNTVPVVFKVNNLKQKPSIDTSLITATLESLISPVRDSGYFQQISLLMFNEIGYEYSLVLKEIANDGFDRIDDGSKSLPIPSQPVDTFCSMFSSDYQFELAYPSGCGSDKNCTPFGRSTIADLPRGLMLTSIGCDGEHRKLRVLVNFFGRTYGYDYTTSFDPRTTLIGEGVWDKQKNRLHVVACRILNFSRSTKDARVGDCSVRLALRFPATASIRDTSYVKGNIWSCKPVNDPGYFDEIEFKFKPARNQGACIEGLKYEYTQSDGLRESCTPSKIANESSKDTYPVVDVYELSFGFLIKNPDENSSSGYATPLYVGDHIFEESRYAVEMNFTLQEDPVNISYEINFQEPYNISAINFQEPYNISMYHQPKNAQISAEGTYDPRTGGLCMIGCKKLGPELEVATERSLDCEIVINFQFSSLIISKNSAGVFTAGSIESTRNVNDSLYFERLELTSSALMPSGARENIWRMDFEIILVLISNALGHIFIGFQLFHVHRRPQAFPFTFLIMVAILASSFMFGSWLVFSSISRSMLDPLEFID